MYECFPCTYIWVSCGCLGPVGVRTRIWRMRTGIPDDCLPPYGCRELNPGPAWEHPVVFIAEPSLLTLGKSLSSLPLFGSKSECLSITENKTMWGSTERGKKLFSFNCIFSFRKNLFTSVGPSPFSLSSKALRSRSRSHILSCGQGSVLTRLLTSTVNLEIPLFGTAGPTCFKSYNNYQGPLPYYELVRGSEMLKVVRVP